MRGVRRETQLDAVKRGRRGVRGRRSGRRKKEEPCANKGCRQSQRRQRQFVMMKSDRLKKKNQSLTSPPDANVCRYSQT
jgi:hypothetical protein